MWKFDVVTFLTVLFAGLTAMVPVVLYQWHNHRQNREQMRLIVYHLGQYPLHEHGEWKDPQSKGPLMAENMRLPKKNGSEFLRGSVGEMP